MAINVCVQYDGGFLPDIILLTQCYFHRETRLNAIQEVLYLQPLIQPKRFDIFSPLTGGCSEGLGIDATHASGKVLRAWKDRCQPYSINILTLLGETLSSDVDKHLETKVFDTGSVKMKYQKTKDKAEQGRAQRPSVKYDPTVQYKRSN